MYVYHGSKEKFTTFDYEKVGLNGTKEGKGFYFTDSKRVASGYGYEGYLYTVQFKGKKPLSSDELTITRNELKQFILKLQEKTDYLSNWGEVDYEGFENVLESAIAGEYDSSNNDVDLISGITNSSGDMELCMTLLYGLFGYDSIVLEADWGQSGHRLYIALVNDVIDIVSIEEVE